MAEEGAKNFFEQNGTVLDNQSANYYSRLQGGIEIIKTHSELVGLCILGDFGITQLPRMKSWLRFRPLRRSNLLSDDIDGCACAIFFLSFL